MKAETQPRCERRSVASDVYTLGGLRASVVDYLDGIAFNAPTATIRRALRSLGCNSAELDGEEHGGRLRGQATR